MRRSEHMFARGWPRAPWSCVLAWPCGDRSHAYEYVGMAPRKLTMAVMVSEAKNLGLRTRRFFASLRMTAGTLAVLCMLIMVPSAALAQVPAPPVGLPPKDVVEKIGIDQKLNEQIPLELAFRDESGRVVALSEYFKPGRPVVLSFVYYRCPMLCTMTLNGMAASFKPLKFEMGKDYDVVTVSFDPREGPDLAAAKKAAYLKHYGREGGEAGWHFLTGDEQNIKALAAAAGFRYYYDVKTDQYAHASGIMVLTPAGRLSRYFYGLEYSTRDLQFGLVEASNHRIGSVADRFLLLCYHYDPLTGRYGWAIMNALRGGAVLTMLCMGTFIYVMVRRERSALVRRSGSSGKEPENVRQSRTYDGAAATGGRP